MQRFTSLASLYIYRACFCEKVTGQSMKLAERWSVCHFWTLQMDRGWGWWWWLSDEQMRARGAVEERTFGHGMHGGCEQSSASTSIAVGNGG